MKSLLSPAHWRLSGDFTVPYSGIGYNVGVSVDLYDLELVYLVEPILISDVAHLHIAVTENLDKLTLDLGGAMAMRRISANKHIKITRFRQSGGKIRITFDEIIEAGTEFALTVRYGGNPRPIRTTWGEIGWEET